MLVSTFPTDINASRTPDLRVRGREALDPDDYSGGFALWTGTSFSAPLVAAHIVAALRKGAEGNTALKLSLSGQENATRRALAALTSLDWPADEGG